MPRGHPMSPGIAPGALSIPRSLLGRRPSHAPNCPLHPSTHRGDPSKVREQVCKGGKTGQHSCRGRRGLRSFIALARGSLLPRRIREERHLGPYDESRPEKPWHGAQRLLHGLTGGFCPPPMAASSSEVEMQQRQGHLLCVSEAPVVTRPIGPEVEEDSGAGQQQRTPGTAAEGRSASPIDSGGVAPAVTSESAGHGAEHEDRDQGGEAEAWPSPLQPSDSAASFSVVPLGDPGKVGTGEEGGPGEKQPLLVPAGGQDPEKGAAEAAPRTRPEDEWHRDGQIRYTVAGYAVRAARPSSPARGPCPEEPTLSPCAKRARIRHARGPTALSSPPSIDAAHCSILFHAR